MLLLPLLAIYIPQVQFYLYKLSGPLTAEWGPLATEALTIFPLVSVSVACVATYLEGADFSRLPAWAGDAMPGIGSWGVYKLAEAASARLLSAHVGRTFLQTRVGLEMVLAASYTLLAPSRLVLYAVPALLHTAFLNTHLATPLALQSLNGTLRADGWAILDRRESVTGYISVLENLKEGFRSMRCDHSLLGGEWVRYEANPVAEPIYGVFVMLEAVRLVETAKKPRDKDASALVMWVPPPPPPDTPCCTEYRKRDRQADRQQLSGLGIGTAPAALVAHGIDTTVVEIDPVVHEFAAKYFHLPANHTAVIDDAVSYTARLASDPGGRRFDYIIHDVFTGGAEPIALFTLEFIQSLDALLKPDGAIALVSCCYLSRHCVPRETG